MRILAINDISGAGNCSLVSNISVFSTYKHEVFPIPSSVFSLQTGFVDFTYFENEKFEKFFCDVTNRVNDIDAIHVGFLACEKQVDFLISVCAEKRAQGTFVLIDPVMADNGKFYAIYDENYANKIRELTKSANLITPNLTEACILAGLDYFEVKDSLSSLADVYELCSKLSVLTQLCQNVVVTSITLENTLFDAVFTNGECHLVSGELYEKRFSGCGDLFASIVLCEFLKTKNLLASVEKASSFVGGCTKDSQHRDSRFGVDFAKKLYYLVQD